MCCSPVLPCPLPCPQILKIDNERKAIIVKGSVPGKPGTVLEIMTAKIVGTNC